MKRLPSGDASDATISEDLYTSTRTLQRRLKDEGTTFKTILGEVRRELAEKYISDDSLSLSEISFLLGFSFRNFASPLRNASDISRPFLYVCCILRIVMSFKLSQVAFCGLPGQCGANFNSSVLPPFPLLS